MAQILGGLITYLFAQRLADKKFGELLVPSHITRHTDLVQGGSADHEPDPH